MDTRSSTNKVVQTNAEEGPARKKQKVEYYADEDDYDYTSESSAADGDYDPAEDEEASSSEDASGSDEESGSSGEEDASSSSEEEDASSSSDEEDASSSSDEEEEEASGSAEDNLHFQFVKEWKSGYHNGWLDAMKYIEKQTYIPVPRPPLCDWCGYLCDHLRKCGGQCNGSVRYCSIECQKNDWYYGHKHECSL